MRCDTERRIVKNDICDGQWKVSRPIMCFRRMSLRSGNLRIEIVHEVFKLNSKRQSTQNRQEEICIIVEIISFLASLNSLLSREITVCKLLWFFVDFKRFIYFFVYLASVAPSYSVL